MTCTLRIVNIRDRIESSSKVDAIGYSSFFIDLSFPVILNLRQNVGDVGLVH